MNDPTVQDWLAAVNDGVPANAVVVRPAIGFDTPKDVGSPLILIVMQDPGVLSPFIVVANSCDFWKLLQHQSRHNWTSTVIEWA